MNRSGSILRSGEISVGDESGIAGSSHLEIKLQSLLVRLTEQRNKCVETWQDGGSSLVSKILVPKSLHDDICFDTKWFGSISWNKDQKTIIRRKEQHQQLHLSLTRRITKRTRHLIHLAGLVKQILWGSEKEKQ